MNDLHEAMRKMDLAIAEMCGKPDWTISPELISTMVRNNINLSK